MEGAFGGRHGADADGAADATNEEDDDGDNDGRKGGNQQPAEESSRRRPDKELARGNFNASLRIGQRGEGEKNRRCDEGLACGGYGEWGEPVASRTWIGAEAPADRLHSAPVGRWRVLAAIALGE